MYVYLPIAEMSVNIFHILALGGAAGILSGMFGVGGGFLMTPVMIFMGISPAVAVATSANQIVASSVSGFLAHWRKQNVDVKMGNYLLISGLVGSGLGVKLFEYLKELGQIDVFISVSYVVFLTFIGGLMGQESLRTMLRARREAKEGVEPKKAKNNHEGLAYRLPLKVKFEKSKLYISALMPISIGFFSGIIVSLLGIGGGFIMIPAMVYLLHMPTSVVVGTSLYQIIFITANVTFLHAVTTHTVDVLLALLLLTGSVIGAQFGSRMGGRLRGEYLRGILALIVLAVSLRLAFGLFVTPNDIYTIGVIE